KSGTTTTSGSQGYTKSVNSISDEDSPLSPSMAWSREGTSEELSKYQELQMRQQSDGQHRPQAQGMATLLSDTAPLTVAQSDNSLVAKRAEADLYLKSTGGSIQEQLDQKHVDVSGEKKSKSRIPSQSSSASTTTKRTSKSSRTKVSAKASEEGRRHGSDVSTTSASRHPTTHIVRDSAPQDLQERKPDAVARLVSQKGPPLHHHRDRFDTGNSLAVVTLCPYMQDLWDWEMTSHLQHHHHQLQED
ncbi:hypothetical protein BGZ79_002853, partial [Entomortierella chlamydospora]